MSKHQTGTKNGMWKGGRVIDPRGYVLLRMPGHRLADCRGYVYEHRLLAEKKLGRQLRSGEEVHHERSRSENDAITPCASRRTHQFLHRKQGCNRRRPEEANSMQACGCGCGETFPRFDAYDRPRQFVSGHNMGGERGRQL